MNNLLIFMDSINPDVIAPLFWVKMAAGSYKFSELSGTIRENLIDILSEHYSEAMLKDCLFEVWDLTKIDTF